MTPAKSPDPGYTPVSGLGAETAARAGADIEYPREGAVAEPPLLELKGVSRYFKRNSGFLRAPQVVRAVHNVSFSLRAGETLGLVGESGCGKSTLARIITRLIPPGAGQVLLRGQEISARHASGRAAPGGHALSRAERQALNKALPRQVQMVFQDPYSSLDPRMRVGASVSEPLICAGVPGKERREQVAALLRKVGLEPQDGQRYPHQFSGGQKQRIALARALALNPSLLVCDEPVSALDASVQAQVLNLLKDLQDQLNLSFLFISHDLAVISHMSDRVAVMYLGSIVELSPAVEFFSGPRHPYSRTLLEALPGKKRKTDAQASCHAGVRPAGLDVLEPAQPVVLDGHEAGCAFSPICPRVLERCHTEAPLLIPRGVGPEHLIACHNCA